MTLFTLNNIMRIMICLKPDPNVTEARQSNGLVKGR